MSTAYATITAPAPTTITAKYNYAIGYLRAFIVALVVAHHAALAYHPYAPPPPASLLPQPRWWGAFPVVDPHKWSGAALLVGFNDLFFMSLMFFLSGLFVWHALAKKGAATFLRDRLRRLGLPFVVAAAVLAPLAYYPTYLQISGHTGIAGFWHQWLSLGNWPVGPAWFIAVLFAFDCIAALLFAIAPKWGPKLGALTSGADRRPMIIFVNLIAVTAIAYIPLAHHFTSLAWWSFGPFAFQISRISPLPCVFPHRRGSRRIGPRSRTVGPSRQTPRAAGHSGSQRRSSSSAWPPASPSPNLQHGVNRRHWPPPRTLDLSSPAPHPAFAFLALFLRFAQTRSTVWNSLAENSYGIYLIHYAVVSWLQYELVPASLPGIAKWLIVFHGALFLSWATSATLRRIPAVSRVI